jgi:hypothetical protein
MSSKSRPARLRKRTRPRIPSIRSFSSTYATTSCTTIEYKSQTRKHVASQGYRIIASFGDQFSDPIGGRAERTVKLPNPTYYLP